MINVEKKQTEFLNELEMLILLDNSDIGRFRERCFEYFSFFSSYLIGDIQQSEKFASEVITFVSIAYISGKHYSLRQFFKENEKLVNSIAGFAEINSFKDNKMKVLFNIVYAIILFIKGDYYDAFLQIELLKTLQKKYEAKYLESMSKEKRRFESAELLSLYYFARAVQLLSYLAMHFDEESIGIKRLIKHCINTSQELLDIAGNTTIGIALVFVDKFVSSIIEKKEFYICEDN